MECPELERYERKRLWGRLSIRVGVIVAVVLFILVIVPPILSNFLPFILALIVAWLLHPLVRILHEKIHIPRKILSIIFVVIFFVIVGGLLTLLLHTIITEIISFTNSMIKSDIDFSTILSSDNLISNILSRLPDNISTPIQNVVANIAQWLSETISSLFSSVYTKVGEILAGIPSFFIGVVLFLTAMYYILADYSKLRTSVLTRFSGEARNFFGFIKTSTFAAFWAYLRAQLLLSLGVLVILLIGFLVTGQNYALLLAFVLAIIDFIPLIGSGGVLIPWALIALFSGDYTQAIQLMVIWGAVSLFRRLLEPKIIGTQTGLSPLRSLISIYLGMRIAGVLGMILAPILLQVFLKIIEAGMFSGLVSDAKLFIKDCAAILKNKPKHPY